MKKTRLYVCRSDDLSELLSDIIEHAPAILENEGSFIDGYLSGIRTALKLIDLVQVDTYEYQIEAENNAEA